ncbi:MAG TPA: O-antigen ligase [Luteimonas sp.]|nr:O-antigen ligase [Luteimonas sp.]
MANALPTLPGGDPAHADAAALARRVRTPSADGDDASPRLRAARALCAAALFLLPACAIATPWGLWPFAGAIVPAMLLAPDRMWRAWPGARAWVAPLLLLAALVTAVATTSRLLVDGVAWHEVDNRARMLVMPLFALAVAALRPSRAWLWRGAVAGLLVACAVALHESLGGTVRTGGWTNPIVFADTTLALMVLAAFCRPPRRTAWVLLAQLAGLAAIGLSGSRGAWPGLAVLATVALLAGNWRIRLRPRTWVLFACLLSAVAWVATPLAVSRIDALQRDAARYEAGDVDSSLGARLDLLHAAGDAFIAHPWAGVGVGNFGGYLQSTEACAKDGMWYCRFGHAHSDLPEWAATMGIPGLIAIVLLYGVPLALFARRVRGQAWGAVGAATAGLLFVVTFALDGLTQSMFAHQLSASFYAAVVGVLAGLCVVERGGAPVADVAGRGRDDAPA